ncbi:MAG: glycoside hydrolase family 2 [Clostridium sp.]|nr:glycoside hydrolase family 2 [Clostridium sp.]MDY5895929.1 glycoside hydrolase family 2 TIM barrel-domain containing protein [Oscillospiraceae bacterium]
MSNIRTPWFDKVDRHLPLAEYPRPQFERKDWICLNGEYDYAVTGDTADAPKKYDGKILVPFSVESELSGVGKALLPEQRLWYRRKFTVGKEFSGKEALLHFGAVDWQCSVWVNGKLVGEHTGGYNPFTFNITDVITEGENELVVKVFDPTDAGHQQRGKQILVTKGFWYTATSGIWQTVWLEPVNRCRIDSLRLVPDIDEGVIRINIKRTCKCGGKLYAKVLEGDKVVFDSEIADKAAIPVPDARLWSPEAPFLYTLLLTLDCNGEKDEVSSYFGMRKFSIVKDSAGIPRLGLNNKPYFQRGLLDQGYWPESQLTPPTDEAMIFDIEKMKELGYNMLRKHIKEEPLRWYYHCDRLGMLVWQDMISGGQYIGNVLAGVLPNINIHVKDSKYKSFKRDKPEWRQEFKDELFGMIDNLYNCVSICCWVPFNEGWGQFDAKEIGTAIKNYDPSRFVDHASGWHDQGGPEFKSIHKYILPVHAPTARRTAGRPIVLSEYGGYSWNIVEHAWNPKRSFGYIMFKNSEKLSAAYKRLHESQVIPLINKGLCATVYTQVSDVEFEVNGIYSYDRKILKLDADTVRAVNAKLTY